MATPSFLRTISGTFAVADVERPHCQLRARLADRLRGDDADRGADLDLLAGREVASVALRAHAVLGVAGEAGADPDLLESGRVDLLARRLVDDLVRRDDRRAVLRIGDRVERGAPEDAVAERDLDLVALDDRLDLDAVHRVAVLLRDDDILRDVDELTGEVAGVSRLKGRIRETLAGAVGRNEVLENRQSLAERRGNRALDDVAGRVRHEAAHTGELTDLQLRATGLRVDEHVDRVQFRRIAVLRLDVLVDRLVELLADLLGRRRPDVDDLVVTFAVRDDALLELLLDVVRLLAGLRDLVVLVGRTDHVLKSHRRARDGREAVAELLDAVQRLDGALMTRDLVAVEDQLADRGLGALVVPEAHLLRPHAVEDHATRGRLDLAEIRVAVGTSGRAEVRVAEADAAVVADVALRDAELDLADVVEERQVLVGHVRLAGDLPGELVLLRRDGEEVEPQAHVLRRRHDRLAGSRREDRRRGEHHELRLHLRLDGERHVHGHLVAVEVGVERRADHRVQADRLAFDEHRLERLDRQTVQGRRAVQEHGLVLDHLVEDRPDRLVLALDHLAEHIARLIADCEHQVHIFLGHHFPNERSKYHAQ